MGVEISDFHRGLTVNISAGQILVVKLRVPKGATYGWQPVRVSLGKIMQLDVSFELNDAVSDFQVSRFRMISEGRTSLELKYVRPIKREYQPPYKYFYVTLDIN